MSQYTLDNLGFLRRDGKIVGWKPADVRLHRALRNAIVRLISAIGNWTDRYDRRHRRDK